MHMTREKITSAGGLVLVLALAAGLAGSARAAHVARAGRAAAAQGEAKTLSLFVGRSQHMSVPWPAKGVSLTDPTVADVQLLTPELLLVTGKAVGTTSVMVWSETGQTLEAKIEVNSDLGRLSTDLSTIFPGSGIKVSQSQNVVLVSGTLERAEQAQILHKYLEAQRVNFVDMTSLAGVQQVQVQVRMAEVSRTAIRSLAFNGVVAGSTAFGGSNLGSLNQTSVVPPTGLPATGNNPFLFGQNAMSPSVTLFGGLSRGDLEVFVRALAENEYLHVLAEPNLVALSGAEASFLAGGEIPIPIVQGGGTGGAAAISIQFKPFGISLRFRPTVLGDGAIRLEVSSEASEVSDTVETATAAGFIRTPAFLTRRAETTLEMKSGQTFAMAGLLSERTTAQSSRVPGLGDLPILGALFRSVQYRKGETELLVLVTASLVEPVSETSLLPLPGDTHVDPSDWQLYLGGRLEGNSHGRAEVRAPPRVSAADAEWMKQMGLDRLKGPGAWMSYDRAPAISMARTVEPTPDGQTRPASKE
jgi:pilus assembly protein CpaC